MSQKKLHEKANVFDKLGRLRIEVSANTKWTEVVLLRMRIALLTLTAAYVLEK